MSDIAAPTAPTGAPADLPADPRLRYVAIGVAAAAAAVAYFLHRAGMPRAGAASGVVFFIALVASFSPNLRLVNWRTVGWGFALQVLLALFILKLEIGGVRPGYALFSAIGNMVKKFLEFTNAGSEFVFGPLANPGTMERGLEVGPGGGFIFAFTALPTIIFVSSFFTVLYYMGILQLIVRLMAKGMMKLMQTSGAETLSAAANVFMGQTEAPIIVKPYVPSMTQSELLAMMVGGMATISGGVMAVYIAMGADPIAILTTSVMAAPCGLYLSKILLPETEEPLTRGEVKLQVERQHVNVIDAAAGGASDGTILAINVAAMLIAFLAFIALFDGILGFIGGSFGRPDLDLAQIFSWVFAPVAILMGVPSKDIFAMGDLLGTKLVANEFVAYVKLTGTYRDVVDPRTYTLATFALTGFANLGSIGIQLGGIGGMAPSRRGDLARLGARCLLAGFVATLVNASIASIFL
ncbi:MAG TPA: nucleoside transporter C-terminal domain-containing protein [Vicinamibacteria bacterium]|nr:nucleoside transporter C-terminal domain-containing protein [Vicinamibacteria bacterium]